MSAVVKEKAIGYYPTLWSDERLRILVDAGSLTKEEYKEVTGNDYDKSDESEVNADDTHEAVSDNASNSTSEE